ncbi:MAG: DUF1573 domain-containing protein [Prevotellaceae bacterium]|jgi:hypothetical protein|nr:DUF1573 domain-containing protein [Prevotellaceae bacterium]
MKQINILFAFVMATLFASAQQPAAQPKSDDPVDPDAPVIAFTETSHDFGNVQAGEKATYTFEFVNTGKSPLVIARAQASCGCTVPNWTKTPIEPGQKGEVTATYTASTNPQSFSKTITVYSNAANAQQGKTALTIKGAVIAKVTAPVAANKSQIAQ